MGHPSDRQLSFRPVTALVLNGLMMGLGHLYLGRPRRAVLFFGALAVLQVLLCLAVSRAAPAAKLDIFIPGLVVLVGGHLAHDDLYGVSLLARALHLQLDALEHDVEPLA